jgi:hypothetical protein
MEDYQLENLKFFLLGIAISAFILLILSVTVLTPDIALTQEVADDICYQLTGNNSVASVYEPNNIGEGKLLCEIPSFDNTQSIIIRQNGGEK